ncbi:hypothetical protein ACLOJK_026511 [Asimina triloba]
MKVVNVGMSGNEENVELSDKHGGHGKKFNVVNLGRRSLMCIRGHYGHHCGRGWEPVVVRSVTFETDDGSVYGPFGTEAGEDFSFHLDGARFGGFHGISCDAFLRAIGIYVETDATDATTYVQEFKIIRAAASQALNLIEEMEVAGLKNPNTMTCWPEQGPI